MSLFNRFEVLVGLRYLRAKRKQHFVSLISFVSVFGIVLGVAVLITVMSVFNGFAKEFTSRWLSGMPEVRVMNETGLSNWQAVRDKAKTLPEVKGTAPFVSGGAMLAVPGARSRGIQVTGIAPETETQVTEIGQSIKAGSLSDLKAGEFGVFIGAPLARSLQVGVGEKIALITADGNVTALGMTPRIKQFTVQGIYEFGHHELDANFIIIHINDAQVLFRLGEKVSGVRLKLTSPDIAPQVRQTLTGALQGVVVDSYSFVTDWTKDNATYYSAVKNEKRLTSIVMFFVMALALFNLVSSLLMTVTDKHGDIAILRTLGASPRSITTIFMIQGTIIGLVGTMLGTALGLLLTFNLNAIVGTIEKITGRYLLDPSLYFIKGFPTSLHLDDLLLVVIASMVLSVLATIYPSYRAARVNPAEVLRYE
jgi:lipoprotein-releasing system permease protein